MQPREAKRRRREVSPAPTRSEASASSSWSVSDAAPELPASETHRHYVPPDVEIASVLIRPVNDAPKELDNLVRLPPTPAASITAVFEKRWSETLDAAVELVLNRLSHAPSWNPDMATWHEGTLPLHTVLFECEFPSNMAWALQERLRVAFAEPVPGGFVSIHVTEKLGGDCDVCAFVRMAGNPVPPGLPVSLASTA